MCSPVLVFPHKPGSAVLFTLRVILRVGVDRLGRGQGASSPGWPAPPTGAHGGWADGHGKFNGRLDVCIIVAN